MKALDATLETEFTVENGTITIEQLHGYNRQKIEIPVALWGMFVSRVSSEILGDTGSLFSERDKNGGPKNDNLL
jgi:hypothetical protein